MVFGSLWAKSMRVTIIATLSQTVENAVVKKCSLCCKSVPKKVTIKMRSKYQKLMVVSGAVFAMRSVFQSHANNLVKNAGKRVTMSEKPMMIAIKRIKIATAKTLFCFEAM